MKRLKKISSILFAILVFIHGLGIASMSPMPALAAESVSPKLLSGNRLGELFPANTIVMNTGASYTWQQDGLYATDSNLVASDPLAANKMMDGSVSVVSSASQTGEAYGTVVYDLQTVNRLTSLQVWSEFSAASGLKQVEIHASLDGINYNRVAVTETVYGNDAGIVPVSSDMKPAPYARYVKVVLHKDPAKLMMSIGEIAIWGDAVQEPAILSNNQLKTGGYYGAGTPKLDTKATYRWNTEQPFVTQAGLLATDNEAGAKNDGSAGGLPDLIDGSSTEGTADTTASMTAGSQGQYGTVTFTLNDVYQISSIDVWSKASSGNFMDGYEVLLSLDNINYFSSGYTANPNNRYSDAMLNTPSYGIPGKHAKYVRIVMHNANDSDRLIAGEIAIKGWRLYDATLVKKDMPDLVDLTTTIKNYNTLYLDWSAYNSVVNKVNKYSIYIQKNDFTSTNGLTARVTAENGSAEQKGKFLLVSSLEPETIYYIAVTPTSTTSGERKDVSTMKITTPSVLGGEKIGDIFAINDTPYGGGNYVHHGDKEEENIISKLMLMRSIEGINFNRWWIHDSWVKTFSNTYGIGFHTFYHGPQDVPMENKQGTWTFSTVNEPDLKGTNPSALALQFKQNHESLKAVDNRNLLIEPALGGTEPASMTWLENLYKSDGQNGALVKTYFDVLDVHPYVKNHEGSLPGLVPGAPEMLIGKIDEIDALKAKYGDQSKPVIFSELGWSTYTGSGYLRPVDKITQRNYLARAYMHAIAGGIKRMHWYDFQDDGVDPTNLEHNLGLIDWYGVPKPSYYAYYTMAKVLKDAKFIGPKANVDHPYYGYEYWHEGKNQYITSLWAADESTKTATFQTKDTSLTVVGIDGSYSYLPVNDGIASLTISGAPVFIYSSTGLEISSIDDSFVLKNTSVDVRRGDTLHTVIQRSGLGAELNGKIQLMGPSGDWKLEGEASFTAGTTAIPVAIPIPLNAEEKVHEVTVQVISGTSLVAAMKLKVNVLETVKVRIVPEVAVPGRWNDWNAAIYVENATADKELNGTVRVTEAVYLALGQGNPITLNHLLPGEITKITMPITALPEQARAKLKLSIDLDSGFTKIVERPFNFIAAVNDQTVPIIDGKLSEESWSNSMPIVINRPDQIKNIVNWGGEADLSGKGFLKWDMNQLYIGMEVQDDKHYQVGAGGDLWQGDSIQFAIDTGREGGVGSSANNEFGIALGEQGPMVWRWLAANGKPIGEMTTVQSAVYRSAIATTYELAIPWTELLPPGRTVTDKDIFGFSMLINENDGTTRRGWLEYMSGIGSSKNTQLFGDLIFSQINAPEVKVTGVKLDQPTVILNKGQSMVLNATVLPSDSTNKQVRFTSSDPAVVSVSQEVYGLQATVTGVSAGTATVRVTTVDGSYSATSRVTVQLPSGESNVPSGGGTWMPAPDLPEVQAGTIRFTNPVLKQDGTVEIEVPMTSLEKAIEGALSSDRTLVIDIGKVTGAKKFQLKLPASILDTAHKNNIENIQFRTGLATIALTPDALFNQVKPNSAILEIVVEAVHSDALTGAAGSRIGNQALYDFKVILDGINIHSFFRRDAVQISMGYTLAPDENGDQVIVYHIRDGQTLEVVKNGKYDAATGQVTFTTNHLSTYTALYTHVTFADLQDAVWAQNSIEALAAREIVNGIESDRFAPNEQVTRAQFIQMLMNAFDLIEADATTSFSDVNKDDWFFKAVASAQKLGIIQGYEDGTFGANQPISRQDMAVMASRVITLAEIELRTLINPVSFDDQLDIDSYAQEAVKSMQAAGIINGLVENRFAPDRNATRAQAAKIIYGLLFM
ncbi:S-layer homology domain-containing protein [Paenibacillus plantarum]|nr:S-layer homology domain-containing protein [Paenibacillus plantarum]